LLGFFGVILQIIGYFLALKLTSVSFAMIGFQLSIIIIAVYEHGIRLEKLDIFKILYLIILIFCISIIIYVKSQEFKATKTTELLIGGIYIVLFALCISLLNIGINRDSYSEGEIKLINKNPNYKIVRMLFKISLTFLIGIAFLFPFLLFIFFVPLEINLYTEIKLFFNQFANIWSILCNWEIILLIVFSTIIPYILIFVASFNWIPYNLSYGQWNSILSIIEPIGGLFFGVLFVKEIFPIGYLIIIIFLLIISILFRYINESRNKINAYILIGQKQGFMKSLQLNLLQLDGVESVRSLIGTHDILVNVKTNSIKDIYHLINEELKIIEGIETVDILFIDKINKYKS
jgi:DNA-binding Lrp family transcriptional regulator